MPVIIRGLSGLSKKIKDATATPADIIGGKVAYGNDHTRMVGTHVCQKKSVKLMFAAGEAIKAYETERFSKYNRIGCAYSNTREVLEIQTDPNYIYFDSESIISIHLAYDLQSSGFRYIFKSLNVDIPWNENLGVAFIAGASGRMSVIGSRNIKNGWYAGRLGDPGYVVGSRTPLKVKCQYEKHDDTYEELFLTLKVNDKKITQIGLATGVSDANKPTIVNDNNYDIGFELSWI